MVAIGFRRIWIPKSRSLVFTKEAEGMEMHAMASLVGDNFRMPQAAAAASAQPGSSKDRFGEVIEEVDLATSAC